MSNNKHNTVYSLTPNPEQFGWRPFVTFFAGEINGAFDWGHAQRWRDSQKIIPSGSLVMINLEGDKYLCHDSNFVERPNKKGLDARLEIIRFLKCRADCQWGFFSAAPTDDSFMFLEDTLYQTGTRTNFEFCRPIVEASDFVCPCWYFNKLLTNLTQLREYWTRNLDLLHEVYPLARILPIIWACWVEEMVALWNADKATYESGGIIWTPELLDKVLVPKEYFLELFSAMKTYGKRELLLWNEAQMPVYPNRAPFKQIFRWQRNRRELIEHG